MMDIPDLPTPDQSIRYREARPDEWRYPDLDCGVESKLVVAVADTCATKPATPEGVATVLDGQHSNWKWIRLPGGDLMLGVYPQGDTYFAVESEVSGGGVSPGAV